MNDLCQEIARLRDHVGEVPKLYCSRTVCFMGQGTQQSGDIDETEYNRGIWGNEPARWPNRGQNVVLCILMGIQEPGEHQGRAADKGQGRKAGV